MLARTLLTPVLVGILSLWTPAPSSAQEDLREDPNEGRWKESFVISKPSEAKNHAKGLERLSDSFRKRLGKALNDTIINGTKKEKKTKKYAANLENALDAASKSVGKERFNKARKQVRKVVKHASRLEQTMRRLEIDPQVAADWDRLRKGVDLLANFYELPPVG